jgi:hypothetical protein
MCRAVGLPATRSHNEELLFVFGRVLYKSIIRGLPQTSNAPDRCVARSACPLRACTTKSCYFFSVRYYISLSYEASRERPTRQIDVSRGRPARYALAQRRVVIFFGKVLYKSIIRGLRNSKEYLSFVGSSRKNILSLSGSIFSSGRS